MENETEELKKKENDIRDITTRHKLQLNILEKFTAYYRQGLGEALRGNDVESTWLSGLDEGTET